MKALATYKLKKSKEKNKNANKKPKNNKPYS